MVFSLSAGGGQGLPAANQYINWYPVPLPNNKTDKIPCDAFGNAIDAHTRANWRSLADACRSAHRLGFVLGADDPYICIDVDYAYSMATGMWSDLARNVLECFPDAYTEVSQSGTGLHVIFRGTLPAGHRTRRKGLALEVYSQGRFIALTGHMARGNAEADYSPVIVGFMQHYGLDLTSPPMRLDEGRVPDWRGPEDDDVLLAEALSRGQGWRAKAKGSASFSQIWEMDIPTLAVNYPPDSDKNPFNHSSVDAALMAHLSYFTGRDAPRMVRLFQRWKGYRPDHYTGKGEYRVERVVGKGLQNSNVMQWDMRGPGERAFEAATVVPPNANFLNLLNGADINRLVLPERQYIVEDFLPTGCLLLVGKPKKGKSWMSLELAVAVASGTEFLGHQCVKGRVIYFALEDNLRRIQSRMRMVCNAKGVNLDIVMGNVLFATIDDMSTGKVPNVDGGFNEMLFNTFDTEPTITLAIVDTLNVIRPTKGKNEDMVMYDRRCVEPYTKGLASRPGRCVLIVHHARKAMTDDVADGASGTLGITAAADGSMFLTVNAEGKTELHGQGRDMERFELVVELQAPLWKVIGDADGLAGMSGIRAKILQCVTRYALGIGPKDIAEEIKEPATNVRVRLAPMVIAGLIMKTEYGKYVVTPKGASLGIAPSPDPTLHPLHSSQP